MFDASGLLCEQNFADSEDGTKVPYFVIRPKDLPFDGSSATLLDGYGGFEVSMTPYYSAGVGAAWLERGGVKVIANIRGGGEYGPAWHQAALKANRHKVAFPCLPALAMLRPTPEGTAVIGTQCRAVVPLLLGMDMILANLLGVRGGAESHLTTQHHWGGGAVPYSPFSDPPTITPLNFAVRPWPIRNSLWCLRRQLV